MHSLPSPLMPAHRGVAADSNWIRHYRGWRNPVNTWHHCAARSGAVGGKGLEQAASVQEYGGVGACFGNDSSGISIHAAEVVVQASHKTSEV